MVNNRISNVCAAKNVFQFLVARLENIPRTSDALWAELRAWSNRSITQRARNEAYLFLGLERFMQHTAHSTSNSAERYRILQRAGDDDDNDFLVLVIRFKFYSKYHLRKIRTV